MRFQKGDPSALPAQRLGGKRGGPARAKVLTPHRRCQIARLGGLAAAAKRSAAKPKR